MAAFGCSESARGTKEEMPSSLIQREEQGLFLCMRNLDFYESFTTSFFSLFANLSPKVSLSLKAQPLESMMEQLIYRRVCCGFGGRGTNEI